MAPRTLETPFRGKTDAYAQPTASERAALAADRARIADLNAQILELESSLQSLKENRELVQSRLNAYTYPVLTLPNEVVSEIFVHVLPVYPKCPPPIGHLSPNLLCQICQKWRSIALTTPAIWRAISLSLRKIRRLEQKHQLLDNSLGRSGSCLLSIKLHSNIADDQKLAQFGQTIADKCAWWEHLQLCIPDPLNVLPNKELSLPFLRTLRLGPDRLMSVTRTFLTAPLLQKVDLASYSDAYGPIFPWSQLTVLSVDSLSWNQYADILNQLVNISYCRFRISPISVESNVGESRLKDVTLPYLETFVLEGFLDQSMRGSPLNRLTLPALRRLQVRESILNPIDPTFTLVSLTSRSGCSLQELCVPLADLPGYLYSTALPSVVSFSFFEVLDFTEPFLQESNDGDAIDSSDDEYWDNGEEDPSSTDPDGEEPGSGTELEGEGDSDESE